MLKHSNVNINVRPFDPVLVEQTIDSNVNSETDISCQVYIL